MRSSIVGCGGAACDAPSADGWPSWEEVKEEPGWFVDVERS